MSSFDAEGIVRVTLTEVAEVEPAAPAVVKSGRALDTALRFAPYAAIWIVLLVPTVRTMVRGWVPVGDDASIALQAWNTFSLHAPLVGQATGAATGPGGVQTTGNPGPLEFWLLGPFAHIDPRQGVLLGSALLCGAALTFGLYVLQKCVGLWAAVVMTLVVLDLALVSPLPFVDPVWNSSFASFWFLSYLAVAFAVGAGNMRYLPFLVFIGSVTVDAHLLFLPSTVLILIAVTACGLLQRRPTNYRWLWWTIAVAVVCWIAPVLQQLFGSHPNGTALLHSVGLGSGGSVKTFGGSLGLRALARAASPKAVWATPRPIQPVGSYGDVLHNGTLIFCLAFLVVVAVFVLAWLHKKRYLASLTAVTIAASIGLVLLYDRVPKNYVLAFQWISLAVWIVGICIWISVVYGVVVLVRNRLRGRLPASPEGLDLEKWLKLAVLTVIVVATIAATLVVTFPYGGNGQRLDFVAMGRVKSEAAIVEKGVPRGDVGIAVQYTGPDYLQSVQDERGVAYLLRTAGWVPGLPVASNGLLNYPIHPDKPFVVFMEHLGNLTGSKIYSHYAVSEILSPSSSVPKTKVPKGLKGLKKLSPSQVKNLKKLTPAQIKNLQKLKHPANS
jgi:hypothetical protein